MYDVNGIIKKRVQPLHYNKTVIENNEKIEADYLYAEM